MKNFSIYRAMSFNKNNHVKFFLLFFILLLITVTCSNVSYATYKSDVATASQAKIAKWSFNVSGEEEDFTINLEDTIDPSNPYSTTKVVPGTYGSFDLNINLTGTDVAANYALTVDNTSVLPTGLKIYVDSAYTTELTSLTGSLNGTNIIKTIYWKWDFDTSQNDQNQNISLVLNISASQEV